MVNKKSRNKNKGKFQRTSKKGRFNIQSTVVKLPFKQVAFAVSQATSGNGCLTQLDWGIALAASNTAEFDPYNAGARFKIVASQYQQYRLTSIRATYTPLVNRSGLIDIVAGSTTTPTYANRSFALCMYSDPAVSTTSFASIVETGGSVFNVGQPKSVVFRSFQKGWLWVSSTLTTGNQTGIDYRLCAAGEIAAAFSSTSTTATQNYGFITLDYTCMFRYPLNNAAPIGSTLRDSFSQELFQSISREEKIPDGLVPSGASSPVSYFKVDESKSVEEEAKTNASFNPKTLKQELVGNPTVLSPAGYVRRLPSLHIGKSKTISSQ